MRRAAVSAAIARLSPALLAAAVLAAPPAAAQEADAAGGASPRAGGESIAVYRNDLALVTTRHDVDLDAGTATLGIDGISPQVVPGSLDVAGDGLSLIEQSLAPWPLDRQRLLQAFLGREVTLVRPGRGDAAPARETARVLSVENGLVLEIGDKIEVDPEGRIVFPELPADLAAGPRADVRLRVAEAGSRTLELRYLTRGVSWQADYVARYDEAAGTLDLTALATLSNALPVAVAADRLSLVAGEVSLAQEKGNGPPQPLRMAMRADSAEAGAPAPESAGDLKVYDLDRGLDLPAGGSVQMPLMQTRDIAVEQQYRVAGLATAVPYEGARGPASAEVRLRVPDTRAAGLDAPLPAGAMRVYADTLYRGGARVDDVPVGGELTVDLGRAFDITATARQTDFEQLGERDYETAQEVVVSNAKDRAVRVQVVGSFPPDWEMRSESRPHEARDATTPVWTLDVPAGGETTLAYRVRVRR